MPARHISKGGLGFGTCFGCLNYRPLKYSFGGWGGPWLCRSCCCRGAVSPLGLGPEWAATNKAYLAGLGWTGRPSSAQPPA